MSTETETLIERLKRPYGQVPEVCAEAAATLERVERELKVEKARSYGRFLALRAAEAQVEALRKALEPFAALAREMMEPRPDNEWLKDCKGELIIFSFAGFGVTIADLRKLAALSAPAEESEEVADFVDEDLQCLEGLEEESAGQLAWQKPEAEHDDGEISVSAFSADNRRSITFTLKADHVVVTECEIGQPAKSRKLYVTPPAEARSERRPAWMETERCSWVYNGLLAAARDLRARGQRARERFNRPNETANLYREPSDWFGDTCEEAARVFERRAVELAPLPTPPKA